MDFVSRQIKYVAGFFIWTFIVISIILLRSKFPQRFLRTGYFLSADVILCAFLISWLLYILAYYLGIIQGNFINLTTNYYTSHYLIIFYFFYIVSGIRRAIIYSRRRHGNFQIFSDVAAKSDNLGREQLSRNLAIILSGISTESTFVMAITGPWGHGKSSLVNFICDEMKPKANVVHIFDPWYFSKQENLIKTFFLNLNEAINKKYFSPNTSYMLLKFGRIISGTVTKERFLGIIDAAVARTEEVAVLKKEINNVLVNLEKPIIFFIDNIDRLDKEEILLMFKLVGLCADFKNLIFVLLYDKDRVEKILKKEIDADITYLDKFIQVEIELPTIETEIIDQCFDNLLETLLAHHEIKFDELVMAEKIRYTNTITLIRPLILNMRIAKRFCNRLSVKLPMMKTYKLNFVDFFVLESIGFFYPDQYKELCNECLHFVFDTQYSDIWLINVNENRKKIYDEFFGKVENKKSSERLQSLMAIAFNSVKNYNSSYMKNLYGDSNASSDDDNAHRIDNPDFCHTYFSFTSNSNIVHVYKVDLVIDMLNKPENDEDAVYKAIKTLLSSDKGKRVFIDIRDRLDRLESQSMGKLLNLLIRFSVEVNKTSYVYIVSILANIMMKKDVDGQQQIIDQITSSWETTQLAYDLYEGIKNESSLNEANIKLKSKIENNINLVCDSQRDIIKIKQRFLGLPILEEFIQKDKVEVYIFKLLSDDLDNIPIFLEQFFVHITNSNGLVLTEMDHTSIQKFISRSELDNLVKKYRSAKTSSLEVIPESIRIYESPSRYSS